MLRIAGKYCSLHIFVFEKILLPLQHEKVCSKHIHISDGMLNTFWYGRLEYIPLLLRCV